MCLYPILPGGPKSPANFFHVRLQNIQITMLFWLFVLCNYLAVKKNQQNMSILGEIAAIWNSSPYIFINKFYGYSRFQGFSSKFGQNWNACHIFIFWARDFIFWILAPLIYALRMIKKNRQFQLVWPFSSPFHPPLTWWHNTWTTLPK